MTTICKECAAFKNVGEKCWYYWNGKKSCSQYKRTNDDTPAFHTIEEHNITLSTV